MANYTINPPRDTQFMDHIDYYLFLEKEKERRKGFQPLWYNFNLLAQGRTLQV